MIAGNRRRRPGASAAHIEEAVPEELESCPFCAGREDRTPPETLRIGDPWQVRVVPNLYPAFERQEVVIHSPRHVRSFADLHDDEVEAVSEAWQRRLEVAADEGFSYVHVLINEGRAAGASLAHSHSQLVWMREAPPEVEAEATCDGSFELMKWVHGQEGSQRPKPSLIVGGQRELIAFCHPAGRVPYELLLQNAHLRTGAFEAGDFPGALLLLRAMIRRLRAVEGPIPWNAWLHHTAPWHIHVLPRLSVFAGIELGAGIYVNTLAPEDAAAALREAL